MQIEDAEATFRALLRKRNVSPDAAVRDVLRVFREFCQIEAVTDSDMTLWEVGGFEDWTFDEGNDDIENGAPGAARYRFCITRQLERGEEVSLAGPSGFYQVRCGWYFEPDPAPASEFARWRADDESVDDFFDVVEASAEFAAMERLRPVRASIEDDWQ